MFAPLLATWIHSRTEGGGAKTPTPTPTSTFESGFARELFVVGRPYDVDPATENVLSCSTEHFEAQACLLVTEQEGAGKRWCGFGSISWHTVSTLHPCYRQRGSNIRTYEQ